jgi:peptidoglycan/LPS O-acetylase OafA/YrhL
MGSGTDMNLMEAGIRSRRRERELASVWLAWGAAYLVSAVVSALRQEMPPARDLIWGPAFAFTGWVWLTRPLPQRAPRVVGRNAFFLTSALYGLYLLTFGLMATDNRVSWTIGLIGGVAFLSVSLHGLVGGWMDGYRVRRDRTGHE